MSATVQDKEIIRQLYKPDRIKVLLVGESPPSSRRFFYEGDTLTQYTREAFARVFGEVCGLSNGEFLEFFQSSGFYLDDLCLMPVNGLTPAARKACHREGVSPLAKRLAASKPEYIVAIMKGIGEYVKQAIVQAGLDENQFECIPFGGNGRQGEYRARLAGILQRLKDEGMLG